MSGTRRHEENIRRSFLKCFEPNFDKETFEEVKKYFQVALCTNFVQSWWNDLKVKIGVNFDYELISSSLGMRKPVEQVFLKVADYFKVMPEKCVYVADETDDLVGAKQAGMQTVLISNVKKHIHADYVYPNLKEFMEALI